MGSPAIFSGQFTKLLTSGLKFKDIARILTGTADPSVTATLAEKGSLYLRQTVSGNGQAFIKLDNGSSTNWLPVILGGTDFTSPNVRFLDKLADSSYEMLRAVDIATDGAAHINTGGSTGAYSSSSQEFKFSGVGQTMVSTQLLSAEEFLNQELNITKASLSVMWDESATDSAATYELTRDGGTTWQTVTMARTGLATDEFEGEITFAEEVSFSSLASHAITNSTLDLNASTQQKLAQSFTISSAAVVTQLALFLTKTGSPSGYVYVGIARDSAGSPGSIIVESAQVAVSSLSTGSNTITIPDIALASGTTYWLVVRTDAAYQASYVNGVTSLAVQADTAGTGTESYNGTTWSVVAKSFKYTLSGKALNLQLRVTSSASNTAIKAFAVYYYQVSGTIAGVSKLDTRSFLSNTDNLNTFVLGWIPDPNLLRVYWVEAGQVFTYPSFVLNGTSVIFAANFFQQETDTTITLKFVQLEGSSFDNSDANAALLATNHLGSITGGIDKSVSGRGIILRNGAGVLRELAIDANDNITISSVP